MDPQIEEVKAKTDLARLIGQYVKLTPAGRNLKGLCPFHGEHTPSFMVSPERGTWRCFGCGEHGDAITFLEKRENVSFTEALEQLARQAGVELKRLDRRDQQGQTKQRLLDALNLAAEYYQYILQQHSLGKEAREYLDNRGINQETNKKFTLGFAPDSWHSLSQFLTKKGFQESEINQAGLLSNRSGRQYDMFRRRLMFPVRDSLGRVVGFSGRSLAADGSHGPKYLNSSDSLLFHKGQLLFGLKEAKEAIRRQNRIILVEGNVDVLSSHQAGIQEVVAPLGTALTFDQISIIKRFTQNLIIAYDGDKAGQQATRRAIELLRAADISISIAALPEGQDPDSLARQSPSVWQNLIDQAQDVVDYYLAWITQSFNLQTEQGRTQAIQNVLPLLRSTGNNVNQAFVIQKAAAALLIDERLLRQALISPGLISSQNGELGLTIKESKKIKQRTNKVPRRMLLTQYLLSAILTSPSDLLSKSEIERIFSLVGIEDIDPEYQPIYQVISEQVGYHHSLNLADIAQKVPASLQEQFDQLSFASDLTLLANLDASPENSNLVADLSRAAIELQQLGLKDSITALTRQLKQAEALNINAEIVKKELVQKTKKLSNLQQKESIEN